MPAKTAPGRLYCGQQHGKKESDQTQQGRNVAASFGVMRFVDLAPYKNSRLGAYLSRHMTRTAKVSPSQGVSLRSSRLGTLTTRDRGWTCALRSSSRKIINVSFHTCPVPADAEGRC